MPIPTWDAFMAPVLRVMTDGAVRKRRELYTMVADAELLGDEDRAETLQSGQLKFENRIGWATSYLNRVGALDRPARGQYAITEVGRKLLDDHPNGFTERDLRVLAGDPGIPHTWSALKAMEQTGDTTDTPDAELDPTEQVEQGIARIHADVAADLLSRMHGKEASFFEDAVVKLLVAMGYGGAEGQATVTRQSGDGGIDGIIDQDTLGINRLYVQAKRYASDATVHRPELQAFVGALSGKAGGGVFITTGRFSKGAREYADGVPIRIILIDGQRLTSLMIRFGVGVQVKRTVSIVEVDEDFFE